MTKKNSRFCLEEGQLALVTFDNYMKGKDGIMYNSAAGPCYVIPAEDLLGLTPERSANWFLMIGSPENPERILVAGCQIHYAQFVSKQEFYSLKGCLVLS